MRQTIIPLIGAMLLLPLSLAAQIADTVRVKPDVDYSRTAGTYILKGLDVKGAGSYDKQTLIAFSGMSVGQQINIPGEEISSAVRRYWRRVSTTTI